MILKIAIIMILEFLVESSKVDMASKMTQIIQKQLTSVC